MARIIGTSGNDVLRGTSHRDVIKGKGGHDRIYGKGGKDKLIGGSGVDLIKGQGGNDRINGGSGNDLLKGGNGNDKIKGGSSSDILSGDKGLDKLWGGSGGDVFLFNDGDGYYRVNGVFDDEIRDFQNGSDNIHLPGGANPHQIVSNFVDHLGSGHVGTWFSYGPASNYNYAFVWGSGSFLDNGDFI